MQRLARLRRPGRGLAYAARLRTLARIGAITWSRRLSRLTSSPGVLLTHMKYLLQHITNSTELLTVVLLPIYAPSTLQATHIPDGGDMLF